MQEALDADDGFSVLTRDDLIVAVAFAQLLVEGAINAEVRRRALLALRRQATDVVLSFRGRGGEDARKRQLAEFQRIIEIA